MPILPLPVFEAEADPRHRSAMTDEELYASLEVPKTLVVRFGRMKMVAEYRYDGEVKPGCGTKLVARTFRGTEIVEMLTTTCSNSGCGKSITRQEMLEYIENSGGRDFPFHTNGRVVRVATIDDLNRQSELVSRAQAWLKEVKAIVRAGPLAEQMKVVEVEPILGEEILTIYYMSEDRVDFRDLVKDLAARFAARIEMRQVGARDEARLVADYERCGQHCCCKNFLKVLKPISMRAAKMQKATLDPLKISGRCGRLMCCLRYEDQTYKQLKENLPHRKTRVGTPEGPGIVLDTKILAQLVLVQLEHDGTEIAVPVEEISDPDTCPKPGATAAARRADAAFPAEDPLRGMSEEDVSERVQGGERGERERRHRPREQRQDDYKARSREAEREEVEREEEIGEGPDRGPDARVSREGRPGGPSSSDQPQGQRESRRRRRRGRRGDGQRGTNGSGAQGGPIVPGSQGAPLRGSGESRGERSGPPDSGGPGGPRRRRRRRRGRGRGGENPGGPSPPPPPEG